jgi:hypothetical protein
MTGQSRLIGFVETVRMVSDVGLFSRGDRSRRPVEPDDDGLDHEGSARGPSLGPLPCQVTGP